MMGASLIGVVSLVLGTVIPFVVGAAVAWSFGYSDPVSMTTIGAGAVTYIVGPVTGAAIGASSDVMALSIATGLIKAIIVMVALMRTRTTKAMRAVKIPPTKSTRPVPIRLRTPSTSLMILATRVPVLLPS